GGRSVADQGERERRCQAAKDDSWIPSLREKRNQAQRVRCQHCPDDYIDCEQERHHFATPGGTGKLPSRLLSTTLDSTPECRTTAPGVREAGQYACAEGGL